MNLVNRLIKEGWLKTPNIIEAFNKIKREDFLMEDIKELSGVDEALPIGHGQTISQPKVVAFMMELLQPQEGDVILDIGFGSGWTTALLAEIVGKNGKVMAVEIVPELMDFGRRNIDKYDFIANDRVDCLIGDGSQGYPAFSAYPLLADGFDKILASASASFLPQAWKDQLKIGGRLVCPIGSSIWLYFKKSKSLFEQKEYAGFVFVPLIEAPEL